MELKELLQIITRLNENINNANKTYTKKELLLLKSLKLGEEVGELNNEILKQLGFARADKLKNLDKNELAGEIADVIITALGIAYEFEIDVESILDTKLKKIFDRLNIN
ncbi:MAG: hypothetical protein NWP80_00430 [Candidatus Gracilibacteria bacterium]|nr:hypothetical protein [Candidatus Gracilibacteria bacterium]